MHARFTLIRGVVFEIWRLGAISMELCLELLLACVQNMIVSCVSSGIGQIIGWPVVSFSHLMLVEDTSSFRSLCFNNWLSSNFLEISAKCYLLCQSRK